MKVYISGKIGEEVISDATRRKFARAEEMLRAKGYEVFNPADEKWQQIVQAGARIEKKCYDVEPYNYILSRDIEKMTRCDAVYFLEDWRQSPGAKAEYYFTLATGMRMLFENVMCARDYLERNYYKLVAAGNPPVQREDGENDLDVRDKYIKRHLDEAWLPIAGKEGSV